MLWRPRVVAYPSALGDHVAIWTAQIHQTNTHGFGGEVWGWTAIASLVILPAAFLSGLQFPLLIALLGRGVKDIGKQTGLAVAWNTVGAILGSLAGGFGLLPLLSAPGAWRAAAGLLALLSVALLCVSLRMERRLAAALLPLGGIGVGIWLLSRRARRPSGGTAASARRACVPVGNTNELRKWENAAQRKVLWEADGVESSIAIAASHGLAFIVNGKSDGNAIVDTGTQIMLGLVGAVAPSRSEDGPGGGSGHGRDGRLAGGTAPRSNGSTWSNSNRRSTKWPAAAARSITTFFVIPRFAASTTTPAKSS